MARSPSAQIGRALAIAVPFMTILNLPVNSVADTALRAAASIGGPSSAGFIYAILLAASLGLLFSLAALLYFWGTTGGAVRGGIFGVACILSAEAVCAVLGWHPPISLSQLLFTYTMSVFLGILYGYMKHHDGVYFLAYLGIGTCCFGTVTMLSWRFFGVWPDDFWPNPLVGVAIAGGLLVTYELVSYLLPSARENGSDFATFWR